MNSSIETEKLLNELNELDFHNKKSIDCYENDNQYIYKIYLTESLNIDINGKYEYYSSSLKTALKVLKKTIFEYFKDNGYGLFLDDVKIQSIMFASCQKNESFKNFDEFIKYLNSKLDDNIKYEVNIGTASFYIEKINIIHDMK